MADIRLKAVTYYESKNKINQGDDRFDIYGYTQTLERTKTFFSNPNLDNLEQPMVNISIVDDVIVGRAMCYPTKVSFDGVIMPCMSGSSLEVVEAYRHYDLGVDLVLKPVRDKTNKQLLYADFSKDGINMYKAARFHVFKMPIMLQPRRSRFLLQMQGVHGLPLKILSSIGDLLLRPIICLCDYKIKKAAKPFKIKEVFVVPKWVEELTLNDGHRFMEVHNCRWLQWALDNKFHDHPVNKNRFFIIQRDNMNIGFFMIKERHCTIESRGITDSLMTTVVEWGVREGFSIGELFINRLASIYCNPQTDILRVAISDESIIKNMKRYCFVPHGCHHIVHRDNTKQFKETKDQTLWRLRFGYSDSIFN